MSFWSYVFFSYLFFLIFSQIAAMQAGLLKVVPQAVLDLLTWQELEKKVCGDPEVTVEALKKLSMYLWYLNFLLCMRMLSSLGIYCIFFIVFIVSTVHCIYC